MLCLMKIQTLPLALIVLCAAFLSLPTCPGKAASAWSDGQSARMRLISGGGAADGKGLRAGLEIELAPGFKTYWRVPGDSGVPPTIHFDGSKNLAHAELIFPAPHVFEDAAGKAIGYKDGVVFPLRITPLDPLSPVELKVKLDYAVCGTLCFPVEGAAALTLTRSADAPEIALVAAAEEAVPKAAAIAGPGSLRVVGVSSPVILAGKASFTVKTESQGPATLVADATPADWFLDVASAPASPLASPVTSEFVVTVFDPESGKSRYPCGVHLTLSTEKTAIEVPVRLDGCVEAP
jgi:DsbC/DsbD-like thiol-disulfide interchange protein